MFKWQVAIYKASKKNDIKFVRKLQNAVTKSWDAKLLATRKGTQDNRKKKTAGVDGIMVLQSKPRFDFVNKLTFPTKASLLKRVKIPKPGREEKRFLGILTIPTKALQALLKARAPEWEARWEPHS